MPCNQKGRVPSDQWATHDHCTSPTKLQCCQHTHKYCSQFNADDGGRALHPIQLTSTGNEHEPRRPWGSHRCNFNVRFVRRSLGNVLNRPSNHPAPTAESQARRKSAISQSTMSVITPVSGSIEILA